MMPPTPAPVALLHGVPTCGALWAGVRAHLSRPSWAPDLPGHGAAPPLPTARHGVADHLDALDRARASAGLPAWRHLHLVGTDYGGLLAAELTLRHGARSLTLVSTAAWLGWAPARLLALPGLQRLAYQRYGGARWMHRAAQPSHRERFLADVGGALGDPGLPDRMRATAQGLDLARCASLPARLRGAGVPIRLVWGDRDRHYPLWGAQVLSLVLGAPLRVVGGSGHALPFEQPAATATAIEAGLRSAEVRARAAPGSRRERRC